MSERVIVTRFQIVYYPSFLVIQNVWLKCLFHIGKSGRVLRSAQSGTCGACHSNEVCLLYLLDRSFSELQFKPLPEKPLVFPILIKVRKEEGFFWTRKPFCR